MDWSYLVLNQVGHEDCYLENITLKDRRSVKENQSSGFYPGIRKKVA